MNRRAFLGLGSLAVPLAAQAQQARSVSRIGLLGTIHSSQLDYGPDLSAIFRSAAAYVDRILNGAKAGDLPVQQPTQVKLVLNAKTARTLKLQIPRSLLARADQVIE